MATLERTFKAFASKRRLAIIKYLRAEPAASVGEIADAIKLSLKATSKHLSVLTAINILESEQKHKQVYYRIVASPESLTRKLLNLL